MVGSRSTLAFCAATWLVGSVLTGCPSAPSVEVSVRVDDLDAQTHLGALPSLAQITEQLEILRSENPRPTPANAARGDDTAPTLITRPPATPAQLHQVLRALKRAPQEELPGIARNLKAAPDTLWPQVQAAMEAPLNRPKSDYKAVLDLIGGDVPNRYGHFARAWKRRHGYAVKLSGDWVADLLALDERGLTRPLRTVYRELLSRTVLLHVAAQMGAARAEIAPEVIDTMLRVAYQKGGVLRDEVGRACDPLAVHGVPSLVRRSVLPTEDPERARELPVLQAKYARYLLDRFDRWLPERAAAPLRAEPDLLASLLRAYGETRHAEAAALLLSFADDDTPAVRTAARDAFESFVRGPAPNIKRKSLRLLGGRTSTERAGLTYRGHAMQALEARLQERAPSMLANDPPCNRRTDTGQIDLDCRLRPYRLYLAYLSVLDDARAVRAQTAIDASDALAANDLDGALARLDALVSLGDGEHHASALARRYVVLADAYLARDDVATAAQLKRKAAFFMDGHDADAAATWRADALALESSLPSLHPEGRAMLLAAAQETRPDTASSVKVATPPRPRLSPRVAAAIALVGLALLIATLLGGRFAAREADAA